MPPRVVTRVNAGLIADIAALGEHITMRQLERWRDAHVVPPASRVGLGKGRGTASQRDGTLAPLIAAVARQVRLGYPLSDAPLAALIAGDPAYEVAVRRRLVEVVESHRPDSDQDEDDFDVAERIAASLLRTLGGTDWARRARRRLRPYGRDRTAAVLRNALANVVLLALTGRVQNDDAARELCDALGITAIATESIAELPPLALRLDLETITHAWEGVQIDGLAVAAERETLADIGQGLRDAHAMLDYAGNLATALRKFYGKRHAAGLRELPSPSIGAVVIVGLAFIKARRNTRDFDPLMIAVETERQRFRAIVAFLVEFPEAVPYIRNRKLVPPDLNAEIDAYYARHPEREAAIFAA
jgi:hypothetical protein